MCSQLSWRQSVYQKSALGLLTDEAGSSNLMPVMAILAGVTGIIEILSAFCLCHTAAIAEYIVSYSMLIITGSVFRHESE